MWNNAPRRDRISSAFSKKSGTLGWLHELSGTDPTNARSVRGLCRPTLSMSGWEVGCLHRRSAALINSPDRPRGEVRMPCGFRLLAALGIWLAAGAAFAA